MGQSAQDRIEEVAAQDTWTAEDAQQLVSQLFQVPDAAEKLKRLLARLEAENPDASGAAALKIGLARYMLARLPEAMEALNAATDNRDRRFFQGLCYKHMGLYDQAAEEFERAKARGWDEDQIDMILVELGALMGRLEEAQKGLSKLERRCERTAQYHYVRGLILELSGQGDEAVEAYEEARKIDPECVEATFRLAYFLDLYGQEDEAIELYKECLAHPPIYANALLNLAVLYEDAGKYDLAASCLRRVLWNNPNHARARLFLKDVEAAKTMYYDEDRAKRIARRNALLDTPVSEFELSVRARNCLKKMNIRSLGDLVRTSEQGLLSYKNFGETSLKEIKDMLASKGLRLGQALEEGGEAPTLHPATVQDQGVLATPLDQVDFPIRVRGSLESLGLKTLGDLAAKTEAEMLACKNFGQTSLNEVRMRLREYGLRLREPD